jgi:GDP-L-fucose synthase
VEEGLIMFQNKNVLVTGGAGMVGRALVSKLLKLGANVEIADLHKPSDLEPEVKFTTGDLRYLNVCEEICKGKDYVFNIIGVKGSPKACAEQPADFMVPMLQFNTNMMEAARKAGVQWYLYTSSVGVYSPADVFYEDDVWTTFPSPNDKFAGWAKRMGELQAEAYKIQYKVDNISIVRPANIFGKYDNFNPVNSMVIPSLIRKAQENDVLEVWGDGSPIRDFIFADDVAESMIKCVENKVTVPINLGSGKGFTIKELVEIVVKTSGKDLEIKWLSDKPNGDAKRIMDTSRAKSFGIEATTSLEEGVKIVTEWFKENKNSLDNRYNVFVNH